jgi:hypothetical protein
MNTNDKIDWLIEQLEENGFLCIEGYEEDFQELVEQAKNINNEHQGSN